MKHKIPVKKQYRTKAEELRDVRVRFNLAFEGSRAKEFLSGHPEKLRDKDLKKLYKKAQKALGELDEFLNPGKDLGNGCKNTRKAKKAKGH